MADVQKGARKIQHIQYFTAHINGLWNIRNMNQGKLEMVKQEMEHLNTTVLCVSKLK